MRRSLAALLLLSACSEPERSGRGDTVYWHTFEGHQQPSEEMLSETEEILGLELVESEDTPGAVTIIFAETDHGASWSGGWSCTPFVYLEQHTARVLAHEIGHAFTLLHTDDESNLMFPGGGGVDLTERQIETVRKKLWETEDFCRLPP